jgi:hypothetical protein
MEESDEWWGDSIATGMQLQQIPEPLRKAAIVVAQKLIDIFKEPIEVHDVVRDNIDIEDVPGKEKIKYILAVQSSKDMSKALGLLDTFLTEFWDEVKDQDQYQGLDVTVDFVPELVVS